MKTLYMKNLNMKNFTLCLAAGLFIACSDTAPKTEAGHDEGMDKTVTEQTGTGITVTNGYVRPPLPGRSMAAGYFTLSNSGADDQLISVKSPLTDRVEIHTHLEEDGIMKMRQVESVPLPTGTDVPFVSGGYHVMMFEVVMPEGATKTDLTLEFVNSRPVTVTVPLSDTPPMPDDRKMDDHSGH